jgi:hypothetical protein
MGGPSSLDVLVEWMTEEGNYNRYKGGPGQKGENRNTILGQIELLMKNNFLEHRKKDSIGAKISNIEGQFRDVYSFLNKTGQGLGNGTAVGDEADNLKATMLKICPLYYKLKDIMQDRPTLNAKVTTSSLDSYESNSTQNAQSPAQSPAQRPVSLSAQSNSEYSRKKHGSAMFEEQIASISKAHYEKQNELNLAKIRKVALLEENVDRKRQEMIKREERDIKRELREEKKEEREIQRDEQERATRQAELELVRMKAEKLQREVLKMDQERELDKERKKNEMKMEQQARELELAQKHALAVVEIMEQRKRLVKTGLTEKEANDLIPLPCPSFQR